MSAGLTRRSQAEIGVLRGGRIGVIGVPPLTLSHSLAYTETVGKVKPLLFHIVREIESEGDRE
jgi:hypothetical protein